MTQAFETTVSDLLASIDEFTEGYLDCALWSSPNYDEEGEDLGNLDDDFGLEDIELESLKSAIADCAAFQKDNRRDLKGHNESQSGHDFWLTRNGHGAGFWDRGLGAAGDRLSKACKPYGSVDLMVHEGKLTGF